ncbi:hypothetical protein OQA88_6504 [Cercophora sp. LCS_1]
MDKKQTSPELSQAELLPTQEEQVLANPSSRKQRVEDDDCEPQPKRARLTRKNLTLFDKMRKHSKKTSDPSDDSGSTKTISTTSTGFAIQARKNGILEPRHSKPPTNLEDLHERHARSRETASPPESAYKQYTKRAG